MRVAICLLVGFSFVLSLKNCYACDTDSGSRNQTVVLSVKGKDIDSWTVKSDEVKSVILPNGFKLGVKIEAADKEHYAKLAKISKFSAESVKITLFKVSTNSLKQLTQTWGGANSIQGYGASGGADRVVELGDPGIVLTLLKPICFQTQ